MWFPRSIMKQRERSDPHVPAAHDLALTIRLLVTDGHAADAATDSPTPPKKLARNLFTFFS
jgi:hypothetical protein